MAMVHLRRCEGSKRSFEHRQPKIQEAAGRPDPPERIAVASARRSIPQKSARPMNVEISRRGCVAKMALVAKMARGEGAWPRWPRGQNGPRRGCVAKMALEISRRGCLAKMALHAAVHVSPAIGFGHWGGSSLTLVGPRRRS